MQKSQKVVHPCDGFLDLTATVNGKRLEMWDFSKAGSFRAGKGEFRLFSPQEEDEIDLQSVLEAIKASKVWEVMASKISTWTSPSLLGQAENNIEATESPPSKKQKPQDLSKEQEKAARRFVADVTCVALCMMGDRLLMMLNQGNNDSCQSQWCTIKGIEAWFMGLSDKPYTKGYGFQAEKQDPLIN